MLDYAAGPTQCGTVYSLALALYLGRGEPISLGPPTRGHAKRYNPTQRWSMWVPRILVTQPHW